MSDPVPFDDEESTLTALDRRDSERITCQLEAAVSGAPQPFKAARILDLSSSGVRLLLASPPYLGEKLRLTLMTADGKLFRIPAEVVRCERITQGWAAGCRFARTLDEQEVAALHVDPAL